MIGNSNIVYKFISKVPVSPQQVIYRIFGSHDMANKERECNIAEALSQFGLAPVTYKVENGKRVEECWIGFDPMPLEIMKTDNIKSLVA